MTSSMIPPKPLLSPADAEKLLDLLCSDDDFRQSFSLDPASAMARISPEASAACETCEFAGQLATKEEFQDARQRLLEHLAATAAFFVPYCFMAGGTPPSSPPKP